MSHKFDMDVTELIAYHEAGSKKLCGALTEIFGSYAEIPFASLYDDLLNVLRGVCAIAPFKLGDIVEIVETPDLRDAPGWHHCAHFLIAGARAEVSAIQLDKRGWRVMLQFENESWMPQIGPDKDKPVPVAPENRHMFAFGVRNLRLVSTKDAQ